MGEFSNPGWVRVLAWLAAAIIVSLNIWLIIQTFGEWLEVTGPLLWIVLGPLSAGIILLLGFVILHPVLPAQWRVSGQRAVPVPETTPAPLEIPTAPSYKKILVALDHTERDREAILHGASLARAHSAKVFLVHVEEDVTSQVYGEMSSTHEVESGERYFLEILTRLRDQGVETELVVRHSRKPSEEIVRVAQSIKPDLVVMAAHGHKWWKDLIFGATINAVRHDLAVPVLIVREKADLGDSN
jgi:manganese transport protein